MDTTCCGCKRIFLTATNCYGGDEILEVPPCFEVSREVMVNNGIIRGVRFDDQCPKTANSNDDFEIFSEIARKIYFYLREHDQLDPSIDHQAMVLTRLATEAKGFSKCLQ